MAQIVLDPSQFSAMRADPVLFAQNILQWNPHDAQKIFLGSKARIKVAACGRRFGKSSMMAVDLLHDCLYNEDFPAAVGSYSYEKSKIIFDMIARWTFRNPVVADMVEKVRDGNPHPKILFKNGSSIDCLTTDGGGTAFLGLKFGKVVIDEAAYVADGVFEKAIRPTLLDMKGDAVLISTPFNRNWFWEYYKEGWEKPGDFVRSFHFTVLDNTYMDREEIEVIHKTTTERVWRGEWLAEFMDEAAFVFPWSIIEPNLKYGFSALPFAPQPGRSYVMAIDIARLVDFSAIIVLDVTDPAHVSVAWFERFNQSTVQVPNFWDYCAERIKLVAVVFAPYRVIIDASSAGNPVSESIRNGIPQLEEYTFANSKSNPKKILLVNSLVVGLQQRRLQIPLPTCERLVEELKCFEYRTTEENTLQYQASSGHNDDTVIALSLAWSLVPDPNGKLELFGVAPKDLNLPPARELVEPTSVAQIIGERTDARNPFDEPGRTRKNPFDQAVEHEVFFPWTN